METALVSLATAAFLVSLAALAYAFYRLGYKNGKLAGEDAADKPPWPTPPVGWSSTLKPAPS